MNSFQGHISSITTEGSLSLVGVTVSDTLLQALVIETPESASYLQVGTPITALFKESEVSLGKGIDLPVGILNALPGIVQSITQETLLSELFITTAIGVVCVVVTTIVVDQLQLVPKDNVTVFIKCTDLILSE